MVINKHANQKKEKGTKTILLPINQGNNKKKVSFAKTKTDNGTTLKIKCSALVCQKGVHPNKKKSDNGNKGTPGLGNPHLPKMRRKKQI